MLPPTCLQPQISTVANLQSPRPNGEVNLSTALLCLRPVVVVSGALSKGQLTASPFECLPNSTSRWHTGSCNSHSNNAWTSYHGLRRTIIPRLQHEQGSPCCGCCCRCTRLPNSNSEPHSSSHLILPRTEQATLLSLEKTIPGAARGNSDSWSDTICGSWQAATKGGVAKRGGNRQPCVCPRLLSSSTAPYRCPP